MRTLKGLSRKMEAFQVLGEADGRRRRAQARAAAMPCPWSAGPLRSTSCCRRGSWSKTGRGQTVEITGEPGIGKSRLALELIDKTGLRDDSIVVLQASAQHQNTPLYPIIRRLEQRIGIRKDEAPRPMRRACANSSPRCLRDDEEQHVLIGQLLGLADASPGGCATFPMRRSCAGRRATLLCSC